MVKRFIKKKKKSWKNREKKRNAVTEYYNTKAKTKTISSVHSTMNQNSNEAENCTWICKRVISVQIKKIPLQLPFHHKNFQCSSGPHTQFLFPKFHAQKNGESWVNCVCKTQFKMTFVTFEHSFVYCLNRSLCLQSPWSFQLFFCFFSIQPPHYWKLFPHPFSIQLVQNTAATSENRPRLTKIPASELWLPLSGRLSLKPCSLFT